MIFKDKKSKKKSKNSRNQGFSYYFCLIEGSGAGSGSIPLTNGSGSESKRPKNIRIQRIRSGFATLPIGESEKWLTWLSSWMGPGCRGSVRWPGRRCRPPPASWSCWGGAPPGPARSAGGRSARRRGAVPPSQGIRNDAFFIWRLTEAVDMNGRFQMQGGKNWIFPK